jgi:hypothetical protein
MSVCDLLLLLLRGAADWIHLALVVVAYGLMIYHYRPRR